MADQHIDIAHMVMQARYEMQLEREASSEKGKHLSDMEREDYQKRIDDLLNAVTTLLNANNAMGEKLQKLEKIADAYDELKAENEKLKGELAMRKPPLNPIQLLTVSRMKTRINTSRTEARMMYLQLTTARKRKKKMPLR